MPGWDHRVDLPGGEALSAALQHFPRDPLGCPVLWWLWWLPGGYGSSISEFFDEGRDCVVDSDGSKRCLIVFFRGFSMHLPRIQCHRVQSVRRLNSETEFTLRSSPCMPPRHKYQWVTFVPKDLYDP